MVIMDRYDHKIQFISVINQFSYSDRLEEHPLTSNQPGATHGKPSIIIGINPQSALRTLQTIILILPIF
jgi:hypothetical protein